MVCRVVEAKAKATKTKATKTTKRTPSSARAKAAARAAVAALCACSSSLGRKPISSCTDLLRRVELNLGVVKMASKQGLLEEEDTILHAHDIEEDGAPTVSEATAALFDKYSVGTTIFGPPIKYSKADRARLVAAMKEYEAAAYPHAAKPVAPKKKSVKKMV